MSLSGSEDASLLLAEQRHRFGNFVQLVLGLIRLRLRAARTDETRSQLGAVADLISTLYGLQEGLAAAGEDAFAAHLRSAALGWSRIGADQGVCVTVTAEDGIGLPASSAEMLALVAHELVTNCLEHAFPDDRGGAVAIDFRRAADGHVELCVRDDGIGITSRPASAGGSLGLTLARSLSERIGGSFTLAPGPHGGTAALVRLPPS